jgi:hypothetical protein
MSKRSIAIAVIALASIACSGGHLLSPTSSWGGDFTDRSPPTDHCPGGTLAELRTRMTVSEPNDLATLRTGVPDTIRSQLSKDDMLYTFQFGTAPDSINFWGFSGYLVARGNCVIHAEITGRDN